MSVVTSVAVHYQFATQPISLIAFMATSNFLKNAFCKNIHWLTSQDLEESPVYDQNLSASGVFIVSTTSNTKQIIEEIDVITLSGLIGSIGGSLGMFFGFSLTSYLFFAIEKFTKKIFKP